MFARDPFYTRLIPRASLFVSSVQRSFSHPPSPFLSESSSRTGTETEILRSERRYDEHRRGTASSSVCIISRPVARNQQNLDKAGRGRTKLKKDIHIDNDVPDRGTSSASLNVFESPKRVSVRAFLFLYDFNLTIVDYYLTRVYRSLLLSNAYEM